MTVRSTPRRLLLVLGAVTALGPLATDMYLPAMPDMARVLATSPSLAQSTIATCLVGLALGQLFAGPLSDRLGRRAPLLVGVAAFAGASALCALAPSVWVLLAARLLQGLGGGAAIVIARAVVRDLYGGGRAARVFSQLMLVTGLAPVAAPLFGGQILRIADWRGVFVALLVSGGLIFLGARFALTETLPATARHIAGLRAQFGQLHALMTDRTFAAHLGISGLQGATLFTYISMSSFALRNGYGIGPQAFSVIFALNSVGLVIGSQVNAALVMRLGPGRLLTWWLVVSLTGSAGLVVAAVLTGSLVTVLIALFAVISTVGGVGANNAALALTPHPDAAGSASALLGLCMFGLGAVVPPLVSLLGTDTTVMGATMVALSAGSLGLLLRVRRGQRAEPSVLADLG